MVRDASLSKFEPRSEHSSSLVYRGALFLALAATALQASAAEPAAGSKPTMRSPTFKVFTQKMAEHSGETFESLRSATQREELGRLSFDPSACKFADKIRQALPISDAGFETFRERGFVSLPSDKSSSFGQLYFLIYGRDLPVLVTTDSILHVVHRSLDNTVRELEEQALAPALEELLATAHYRLDQSKPPVSDSWTNSYSDVDLYLTVARNLCQRRDPTSGHGLVVSSRMKQDDDVRKVLALIDSLHMQRGPVMIAEAEDDYTEIYGGRRAVDYSQFKPRGHYTQSETLQRYFRTMMWLSRADCGFNPLGADSRARLYFDGQRERRDAVILADILSDPQLQQPFELIDHAVQLLAGESDNLRRADLQQILKQQHMTLQSLRKSRDQETLLADAIKASPLAQQQIPSQVYMGAYPSGEPVPPPALVQVFGQRFAVDNFVLAHVVHDTVQELDENYQRRWMPRGLDVMAALGNREAIGLLADDLRRWKYAPQLMANRDVVAAYLASPGGRQSIYDGWLGALTALNDDAAAGTKFPEVMRTHAWHLKTLQTQLASWSELHHDFILFAKQSYTRGDGCMYPSAYVEPYPELYARLAGLADGMAALAKSLRARWNGADPMEKFWRDSSATMTALAKLAEKELAGQPFTDDETRMLKHTISIKETHDPDYGTLRDYSGWYCKLLYPRPAGIDQWQPTVADVHTDPNSVQVLETGVGSAQFAVVAIDNGEDQMAFVGPIYTYYEFPHRAEDRLTDGEFSQLLLHGPQPARPKWTIRFDEK